MIQSNSSDNCVHHYNIEILNLLDSDLQLINTKIHTLVKAFKSMHQSNMTKIKFSAREDWIVIETIVKHRISIFEC